MAWVMLPQGPARWFNLSHAHRIEIKEMIKTSGPEKYAVIAQYGQNQEVVLYTADSWWGAKDWVRQTLAGR